jgi:hypothetical protein
MERFSKTTVANKLASRFEFAYKDCSSPDRELAARARGTQAAIEYLSVGFDLGVCQPFTYKRFEKDGKPVRFSKAAMLAAILEKVLYDRRFDRGNGYDQVDGKGEALNEQYAEWRYLLDIASEYA